MRRGRVMTTLGLCGLLLAFSAVSARGQSTGSCTIRVAQARPERGSIQMVIGDRFPTTPSTMPIEVSGGGQVGLASIDRNGHFADPIRVPADATDGPHTISVKCGLQGDAATAEVFVVPPVGPPRPDTDHDVETAAVVVAAVLAIVLALALTTRRRRMQRLAA